MEFDKNELQAVVDLAFGAAKRLKQNGFKGEVDAKDLLAPALYKRLEEANQLGAFGRCVRSKIENCDHNQWPIHVIEGVKNNGRRVYDIR